MGHAAAVALGDLAVVEAIRVEALAQLGDGIQHALGWSEDRDLEAQGPDLTVSIELAREANGVSRAVVDTLLPEGRKFSFLRENLESTELNPDTFPDLKTAQRAFFGTTRPYLEVIRSQSFLKEGALDP